MSTKELQNNIERLKDENNKVYHYVSYLQEYCDNLEKENKNLIDEVDKYKHEVGEWISVEDRLPDELELVLIQNIYGVMSVASRIKNSWYNFQGTELCTAIAWMPLPEPFKG